MLTHDMPNMVVSNYVAQVKGQPCIIFLSSISSISSIMFLRMGDGYVDVRLCLELMEMQDMAPRKVTYLASLEMSNIGRHKLWCT